jgi:SAM-dependent methyltransferase
MKTVLHVGCGREQMPDFLDGYKEIRLDIDPSVNPDIVADLTDLGDIGPFDVIFGSHVLEHLYPHDGRKAMSEFHRVLKPRGIVVMIVPNLANIRPTRDVVYDSPAGPITGLDMYYGKESFVEMNPYMAHKTGFVPETLEQMFDGFAAKNVRELSGYNLIGTGVK